MLMLILIMIAVIIVFFMILAAYSCIIAAGKADREQEKIEIKQKNEISSQINNKE